MKEIETQRSPVEGHRPSLGGERRVREGFAEEAVSQPGREGCCVSKRRGKEYSRPEGE